MGGGGASSQPSLPARAGLPQPRLPSRCSGWCRRALAGWRGGVGMAEPPVSWQGSSGTSGPRLHHLPSQHFRANTQWFVCGSRVSGFAGMEEALARGWGRDLEALP